MHGREVAGAAAYDVGGVGGDVERRRGPRAAWSKSTTASPSAPSRSWSTWKSPCAGTKRPGPARPRPPGAAAPDARAERGSTVADHRGLAGRGRELVLGGDRARPVCGPRAAARPTQRARGGGDLERALRPGAVDRALGGQPQVRQRAPRASPVRSGPAPARAQPAQRRGELALAPVGLEHVPVEPQHGARRAACSPRAWACRRRSRAGRPGARSSSPAASASAGSLGSNGQPGHERARPRRRPERRDRRAARPCARAPRSAGVARARRGRRRRPGGDGVVRGRPSTAAR